MDASPSLPKSPGGQQSLIISLVLLGVFVLVWYLATRLPTFDSQGLSEVQLQQMEFNGDIVRTAHGQYSYNPEKARGLPGPWAVIMTAVEEFSAPFHKRGTNDHGIGHLIRYTVVRFAVGFLAASVVAILLGVVIGLSRTLYRPSIPLFRCSNPFRRWPGCRCSSTPCSIPPGQPSWWYFWPRFGPRWPTPPLA